LKKAALRARGSKALRFAPGAIQSLFGTLLSL
jgi:hypothetical protein